MPLAGICPNGIRHFANMCSGKKSFEAKTPVSYENANF